MQEERIRAYADFVGAEIVEIVVDRGFSGRRADRPGKLSALRKVTEGEADGLVVYAIDRLSRSTVDLLHTVHDLLEAGRGFVSCREQFDSSTPHGRFALSILAALAEMESELISERTKAAMHRLKVMGRAVGRARYACRTVNGYHVEVPERMAVVERILGLRDSGTSYRRIAEILNEDGVPPPQASTWRHTSVRMVEATEREFRRKLLDV